jgi:FkbM family methyltransferase
MQKMATGTLSENISFELPSLSLMAKRGIERIRLQLRAEKYRKKEDRGGIAYILNEVKKGDTVFDIGAHKGGYLYFFQQQVGSNGNVLAFEPQSILNTYLTELQQLLHWQNVRIERSAVSNSSGNAVLSIPYNKGKKSSPCATIIQSQMDFAIRNREEVETITIDDYCRKHRIYPDFLKVDVEGNELSVFIGAKETLIRHKPKILFECEARFIGEKKVADTFAFLQGLGYNGYFIQDRLRNPISEFSVTQHQNNITGIYCNNFIFE